MVNLSAGGTCLDDGDGGDDNDNDGDKDEEWMVNLCAGGTRQGSLH